MDPSGEGWLLVFCDGVDLPGIGDAGMMLQSFLGVGRRTHPFSVESNGLYPLCRKLFSGNGYSSYLVQLLLVVLH